LAVAGKGLGCQRWDWGFPGKGRTVKRRRRVGSAVEQKVRVGWGKVFKNGHSQKTGPISFVGFIENQQNRLKTV
jgi:hypothetical protein